MSTELETQNSIKCFLIKIPPAISADGIFIIMLFLFNGIANLSDVFIRVLCFMWAYMIDIEG